MFEMRRASDGGTAEGGLDASTVAVWVAALAGLDRDVSDAGRIDQIRLLEELKAAAGAAQARAAADLDSSVRAQRASRGLPADLQGQGVASQVALARRESPVRGGRHLGLAKALVHEMPHTLHALEVGRLSEWRATLLVRETAALSRRDRGTVDRILVADPDRLDGVGDRALVAEVRKLAYELDPESSVRRVRKAEADRRVTVRPAPDTMVYLTALLPVKAGIAAYATLTKAADSARAAGDPRGRGQVMADTLVERLTGQAIASGTGLELQVVMTDRSLLLGDDEPARVPGYGPVPSGLVRRWLQPGEAGVTLRDSTATTGGETAKVWVRRLYTHPQTRELVAMDSRRRAFPESLRRFLVARDETCRTPWCDAPIRHADHVVPHDAGGDTSGTNGQGLCEQCNHAKQARGWRSRPSPHQRPGHHVVETTTPAGHTYRSLPPALPGRPPPPQGGDPPWASGPTRAAPEPSSRVEMQFRALVLAS